MRRDCLGRRQEKQWEARFPGSRGGTGEDRDQLSRASDGGGHGEGGQAGVRERGVGGFLGGFPTSRRPLRFCGKAGVA